VIKDLFFLLKGKKVEGADVSFAKVKAPRKYRQYMNRRGGFNRVLDAEPTKAKVKPKR